MGNAPSHENAFVALYINDALNQQSINDALRVKTPIDGTGRLGESALTLATKSGDLLALKLLQSNGADVTLPASSLLYKRSLLHIALAQRYEPVALYLFTQFEPIRGCVHVEDGLEKSAVKIATQKHLYYMLWLMLFHVYCFSAYPLNVFQYNTTRTNKQLMFSLYIHNIRTALSDASSPHDRIPLLFASFGIPCQVFVSAERSNYDYHTTNPQNIPGLFTNQHKYVDLINLTAPPQLSSNMITNCRYCASHTAPPAGRNPLDFQCIDNNCTLACYLGHFHQFTVYLQDLQQQLEQQQRRDGQYVLFNEIVNFIRLTNNNNPWDVAKCLKLPHNVGYDLDAFMFHQFDITPSYQNDPTHPLRDDPTAEDVTTKRFDHNNTTSIPLLPSLLTPPPIILSGALQKSFVCTRTECFCNHRIPPGQLNQNGDVIRQQQQHNATKGCFIYPPLIAVPTMPLTNMTHGYHNADCNLLPIDRQLKTDSINNLIETMRDEKSNQHAIQLIKLHEQYITKIKSIYQLDQPQVPTYTSRQNSANTSTTTTTTTGGGLYDSGNALNKGPITADAIQARLTKQKNENKLSPGFLLPHDFALSRYSDPTPPPMLTRPKKMAERAGNFFSSVRDFAVTAASFVSNKLDEQKRYVRTIDDVETITMNNIRYYCHYLPINNRMTTLIVGPKRDLITPMRTNEAPVHTAFTYSYPQGSVDSQFYDHSVPILDQTYTKSLYNIDKEPDNLAPTPFNVVNPLDDKINNNPDYKSGTVALADLNTKYKLYKRASLHSTKTTPYPPIPETGARNSVDLTQPYQSDVLQQKLHEHTPNTPISKTTIVRCPHHTNYQITCLCGAHTTTMQPIQLEATRVALGVDGRSFRITTNQESDTQQSNKGFTEFENVAFAAFTPTMSMLYESKPQHKNINHNNIYDYGFPIFNQTPSPSTVGFGRLVPVLNQTHDLSTTHNNWNTLLKEHNLSQPITLQQAQTAPAYFQAGNDPWAFLATGTYPLQPEGSGTTGVVTDDSDGLGSLIISPTHHVSLKIPISSKTIVFFASAMHRIMQAKYPHYLLYTQWLRFTTRIAHAVARLSQRRLNQRIAASEITLLEIYRNDFQNMLSVLKSVNPVQPTPPVHIEEYLQPSLHSQSKNKQQVLYDQTKKQLAMYDEYLTLLDKFLLLRKYRLSTSQFTSNNVLATLGGIVATAEYDVELYQIINQLITHNQTQDNPLNAAGRAVIPPQVPAPRYSAPAPQTESENKMFYKVRTDYCERIMTNTQQITAGILPSPANNTTQPIDFNQPIPELLVPQPPDTANPASHVNCVNHNSLSFKALTIHTYCQYLQNITTNLSEDMKDKLKKFIKEYPKFSQNPNAANLLVELEQYYTKLEKFAKDEAARANQPQNTTTPPISIAQQPFTLAENVMLNSFLIIIPNILQHFKQRIKYVINALQQQVQAHAQDPRRHPNVHSVNYQQSIFILNTAFNQASMLEQWLTLQENEVEPHFHIRVHTPTPEQVMAYQIQLKQQRDVQLQLEREQMQLAASQVTTTNDKKNNQKNTTTTTTTTTPAPIATTTATTTSSNTTPQPITPVVPLATQTSYSTPNTPYSPMQSPSTVMVRAPTPQPAATPMAASTYQPTANNSFVAPTPSAEMAQQQQQQQQWQTDQPSLDMLPPPTYDMAVSTAPAIPEYAFPTFRYCDSEGDLQAIAEVPAPVQPAAIIPDKQLEPSAPLYDDQPASSPPVPRRPQQPQRSRQQSIVESGNYFFSMVKEDPRIVLALDDEYVEMFENNLPILLYLQNQQPGIFKELTAKYPGLQSLVDAMQDQD